MKTSAEKATHYAKVLSTRTVAAELIPADNRFGAPDYCSTWEVQGYVSDRAPKDVTVRDVFTDAAMFGKNGWAYLFPEDIRKDLIITICDAWDLPFSENGVDQSGYFGSFLLDETKFPNYGVTPLERIKTFSKKIKEAGWKGLGLWICCQEDMAHRLPGGKFNKEFWIEKIQWSKEAGIVYWENDWGDYGYTFPWREFISDAAQRLYPELIIEHCVCRPGTNDRLGACDSADLAKEMVDCTAFSDVFRTYDVTTQLTAATTTERISRLLKDGHSLVGPSRGYVCCEDELYMAAALGFTVGIMRHKVSRPNVLDEVIRCIRWHRLAPAFDINDYKSHISEEILTDSWQFTNDTWDASVRNALVHQHAPAAIGRGIALPTASGGEERPRVLASRNSITGAISIATLRRTTVGNANHLVYADVELNAGALTGPVGIFGVYKSLTLRFDRPILGLQIVAQDLAGGNVYDITDLVDISDNSLTVDGELLLKIGTEAASSNDISEPGLILQIGTAADWAAPPSARRHTASKTYHISIPEGEGYRIVAEKAVAQRTESFSFTLEIAEGYDGSWRMVTANSFPLTCKNGQYTIGNILADQEIRVFGVRKK